MEDWKELQRQAYQNKVDHGFNVTDVPMEFCLLYGEVGEAYQAWSRQKPDLGEELADVAIYLLGLAEILDLSLIHISMLLATPFRGIPRTGVFDFTFTSGGETN